ncbi:MAG: FliG C-terminal domain-containing protein, partial [Sphingomonadaceae bacterium]
ALKARIFQAMPQRAAQALQDEIANRGPVKIEDAELAKRTIASAARRLSADGVISLPGKGPAYV